MSVMKHPGAKPSASIVLAAVLLVLLGVLATLQYRWLGQVSDAERQRMQISLRSAMARFVDDFDGEVTLAFVYFFPFQRGTRRQAVDYAGRLDLWRQEAPHSAMLRGVFRIGTSRGDELGIERLDGSSREFVRTDWPGELQSLRRLLGREGIRRRRHGLGRMETPPPFVVEDIPALVVPSSFPRWRTRQVPSQAMEKSLIVLQLDGDYIAKELLPELTRRYFGHNGQLDYEVVVTSERDPKRILYASEPTAARTGAGNGDETATFFALRMPMARRQLLPGMLFPREMDPAGGLRVAGRRSVARLLGAARERGRWRITVRHRAGSLEAAVTQVRRRNLAIGFAVLFLLALSLVMMMVSTQRAQDLARQKIEFVAGVSHELKTPLSVIRSAGENLADGKVAAPEQVKRYGALVASEGRRLSDLVDQVLQFAGTHSSRVGARTAVSLREVIEQALGDCGTAIEEKRVDVETTIPDDLLLVKGDPSALRRAFLNLIDNAVKYGNGWVGVRAGREEAKNTRAVTVRIEDRGRGIDKAELGHVFEPFYRGSGVGQIRGSGLGLSLVRQIIEAHGGQVSVETRRGRGSSFIVRLPAVASTQPPGVETEGS